MTLERYSRDDLKHSYCTRVFKTYKSAVNHIKCNTHIQDSIYIIRDENGRILCNASYQENGDYFLITETDNIGRVEQQTIIKTRG